MKNALIAQIEELGREKTGLLPLEIGRRVYWQLYGHGNGTICNIRHAGTGHIQRECFDIVFDDATLIKGVAEPIIRSVQWKVLDEVETSVYIGKMLRKAAELEAERERAEEEAATAREKQLEELRQEYGSWLKIAENRHSSTAFAAANMRKQLKRAFPGVKFSVRSESFSGGDAIRVSWTNGPTKTQVEEITDRYEKGRFDSQEEIYNYRNSPFTDLFGGAKYVSCSREIETDIEMLCRELCRLEGETYVSKNQSMPAAPHGPADIIRKILANTPIPPGATITGLAQTDCKAGMFEEFYRVTTDAEPKPRYRYNHATKQLDPIA